MMAELEKRGELDNTIIIVTADHGMPFPRCKGYAYQDSNHVPLAIRWPQEVKKAGRMIDDFVNFTDIAATMSGLRWHPGEGERHDADHWGEPGGRSWKVIDQVESSLSVITP
jgi:arylsulfatase A-like enzyme